MDLYRDFAYAKVTVDVPTAAVNAQVVLTVDGTTRVPANVDIASADLWMTLESDLVNGAFEIVKVLSTTATSITVLRGQDGTQGLAHPAGTYIKASITASMLRRLTAYKRYLDLGNVALVGAGSVAVTGPKVQHALVGAPHGVGVVNTTPLHVAYKLVSVVINAAATAGSLSVIRGIAASPIAGGAAVTVVTPTAQHSLVSTVTGVGSVTGALKTASNVASKTYAGRTYASGTY